MRTSGGKMEAPNVLKDTICALDGHSNFHTICALDGLYTLNSQLLSMGELFGEFDGVTYE